MASANESRAGVQSLDSIRERLKHLHDTQALSWRKIAALDDYRGIPAGSLCSIAGGREPKSLDHRRILGLPLVMKGTAGGRKFVVTIQEEE